MSNRTLEKIYYKALDAVKADVIVKNNISIKNNVLKIVDNKIDMDSFNDLYIFSIGKAGYDMAKVCEDILKGKIKGGVAVSLKDEKLNYIKHFRSTHPKVSSKSLECADELIKEIKRLKKDDLFIFFLSGGASAMIEKPIEGLSLTEFQKITNSLLISGIDIKALNKERKSLSMIKGGKLADMFDSKGYVLVLSDVIGDDLETIGSAPMYNKNIPHYIIGNNKLALKEAKEYIKDDVEKAKILTHTLDLSSKKAAEYISKKIKEYNKKYDSYALFIGGETKVEVKGKGFGGRNSELALRLVIEKAVKKDISILCAGSDGVDGNSKGNGAFIDMDIYKKIKEKKLDPVQYLKNSDSYSFFKKLDYHFFTGVTGTNVMDFVFILKTGKNKKQGV